MNKTLPILGCGILIGIVATLAFTYASRPHASQPGDVVRDVVDIPRMSETAAEKHRSEQYASLDSVEGVLALPTQFARSEALHVLAGRSDLAGVESLIVEANRIADEIERETLLTVLFSRLTELDPQAALLLARSEQFADLASLEETVWRVWARNDFDDALFAARTETRFSRQRSAARSLYRAFGYMGNETTDRIEAELGIEPDLPTRARYLYRLADRSPAEAIQYINGLTDNRERHDAISSLGYYLSQVGEPRDGLQYAGLFAYAADGDRFTTIIEGNIMIAEPAAAIEKMLAGEMDERMSGQIQKAVAELASTDLDAATRYFAEARSDQHRYFLGAAIVAELAKNEPTEALNWARANDRGNMPMLELVALQQIALKDPQLALNEALASSNDRARSMVIDRIVLQAAMRDPAAAVAFLDQIEDREQRLDASEALVQGWIRTDADAAVDWILGQDETTSGPLLASAISDLTNIDIDAAIRLLPKLDDEHQVLARQRIATMLTEVRSIEDALAFVTRFQGQPGYEQMQADVVSSVARKDPQMARQLADQIQDGAARDSAHMQIIMEHAQTNPFEALGWLESVSHAERRRELAAQVAAQWSRQDPVAATRWVASMPPGSNRDAIVAQVAYAWGNPTAQQTALINSIGDPELRSETKASQALAVALTDPARAREMLQDDDISDEQRAAAEEAIDRQASGTYRLRR